MTHLYAWLTMFVIVFAVIIALIIWLAKNWNKEERGEDNHAIEILKGALLVLREFNRGSEEDKAQITQVESAIKRLKGE